MSRHRARRWAQGAAQLCGLGLLGGLLGHLGIVASTQMTPPEVPVQRDEPTAASDDDTRRELGRSYLRSRGAITEIRLVGSPEQIGHAHVRLGYERALAIETEVHAEFAHYVPWAAARWAIVDFARWRFRGLDLALGDERRREIAAFAGGFSPDPFDTGMETYQRFVFLNSLYDVMLSFERSPLVGCTSLVVTGGASPEGHTLLGRNFDFEGPQILDEKKAVFLVHEPGRIPYASISWPGFVGVASGMNATGVAIVVHGARAREPEEQGMPVALQVRHVLGLATTTAQALDALALFPPMVSHLLLVADAAGDVVVVERAPGTAAHVRRPEGERMGLTNHFEGPLATDPANQQVLATTSTRPRRQRLDEILANETAPTSVERIVEILRDKRALGGAELPLGHRSSIDALIATHSVVMDLTARRLWVSEGPHAAGRFVRFDLDHLLDPSYTPAAPEPLETLPADAILLDGRYDGWVRAGSPRAGAE